MFDNNGDQFIPYQDDLRIEAQKFPILYNNPITNIKDKEGKRRIDENTQYSLTLDNCLTNTMLRDKCIDWHMNLKSDKSKFKDWGCFWGVPSLIERRNTFRQSTFDRIVGRNHFKAEDDK